MCKYILFFLLISFGNIASAEWVEVASSHDDNSIFYVSSGSIKRNHDGNFVAWEIVNYSKKTPQGYLSAKVQQEYNCKSKKVRMLFASTHTELFGKGRTLSITENSPSPWRVIPEGSVVTYTRDYICSKNNL